jgi:hypothetical protein
MHSTNVIDVQEATLRFSKKPRVVLDGVSFCWGVDDGEHLFEMVLNQLIAVSVECGSPLKNMTTQISQPLLNYPELPNQCLGLHWILIPATTKVI